MSKKIINDAKKRMQEVVDNFKSDLASIRAGRASTALLENIYVEYYGTQTPINQVASLSVPEPKMILIQPWDANAVNAIEKAILKSDLNLAPSSDGKVIRLILPELTSERRQELVKLTKNKAEETRVSVRNIRRESNDSLKKMEKDGDISEDEHRRFESNVQELTDKYIEEIDDILAKKEKDIMEV